MASDLKVTTSVSILGRKSDTADLTTPLQPVRVNQPFALLNGTGDDQANEIFADTRTLTATSETLDLTSTLANFAGTTIVYTALKGVWIFNRSTTGGEDLTISGNFGTILGGPRRQSPSSRASAFYWSVRSPATLSRTRRRIS